MNGEITIYSYAKINLSLDVTGKQENGMHTVDMVMQELNFHDDVNIKFEEKPNSDNIEIELKTNRPYLPVNEDNIAFKAAQIMVEKYGKHRKGIPEGKGGGRISIDIKKRIPVAAGLAGGSGNGAAVLHGLNAIWETDLTLEELQDVGALLGSDVPFCVIGQVKKNYYLPEKVRKDPMGTFCARAEGTGTILTPVTPVKTAVVIAKPAMGVSTKEVYKGIDDCIINRHPDNDQMIKALKDGNRQLIEANMINVLEEYTLKKIKGVRDLKSLMESEFPQSPVLMSGSGPTVFAFFSTVKEARNACRILREKRYEAYWTTARN